MCRVYRDIYRHEPIVRNDDTCSVLSCRVHTEEEVEMLKLLEYRVYIYIYTVLVSRYVE